MPGYIGPAPVPQATQTFETFTATAGQTSFPTLGYTPVFLQVHLNGVLLTNGDDFTAENGSDVVLTEPAALGDIISVTSFSTFEVNSQSFTGTTTMQAVDINSGTIDATVIGSTAPAAISGTTGTFSGAVSGTTGTFSGAVSGTTGTFSGSLTSLGIDDNATATALTLDTQGNVGVNTAAPTKLLDVSNTAGNAEAALTASATGYARLFLNDTANAGQLEYFHGDDSFRIYTADSEAARFDAAGNLLVGKPTGDTTAIGTEIAAAGNIASTADSATVLTLNRKTNNGAITTFSKDGVIVGSVTSVGSATVDIDGGSAYTGLRLDSNSVLPKNNAAISTNTVDLGSSVAEFKDLYLGGGVYLGGVTSANYLDDYEEGTFTPVLLGYTGTVYTTQTGRYTKIGRTVFAQIVIVIDTIGTFAGNSRIGNIPFSASDSPENFIPASTHGAGTGLNFNPGDYYWGILSGGTEVYIFNSDTGAAISGDSYQAGEIGINLVYFTQS